MDDDDNDNQQADDNNIKDEPKRFGQYEIIRPTGTVFSIVYDSYSGQIKKAID